MNTPTFSLILMLAAGLTAPAGNNNNAPTYSIVSEATANIGLQLGELQLTETLVQEGALEINRFKIDRLRRVNYPHRGTILLMPALGNNFNSYLMHESGDITKSFAAVFARLGYEVWGYSPRETAIPAGACGAGLDCSAALQWSIQTIVNDATFIRSRIALVTPGKKPVIGGLSLGAMAATAVLNAYPDDYAGLLAWEGSLVTDDPAIQAHNLAFCNHYAGLVSAGIPVDDQNLPFLKLVVQLAQTAPNDPFAIPVPGFPPGLTNLQAFVFVMSMPNPVAPSPRPGFISAAGDFTTGQLFHSDPARLFASIATFNDTTANLVLQDTYCSLAGVETAYTDKLKRFKEPALIIKGSEGFGSILDELPAKLGSKSVTFVANGGYGHVDHLGSANHGLLLELPIVHWLNEVFE